MKKLAITLVLLTIYAIGYLIGYRAKEREQVIYENKNFENPVFIWNDDLESIPTDNSPITLEFTSNDTIYIGPSINSQFPN